MKIVFELPFYSQTCGGVLATIALAKELNAHIYFQSLKHGHPFGLKNWSYGLTSLPECDLWITYSDNPHTKNIINLPQIKNIACYFQSYGMSYDNERANAANNKIWNLCSTKKIQQAINNDGFTCLNIGFGLDMSGFVDYGEPRKNYLAIMYHDMPSKKYDVAVQVADILFAKGIIEGVISFGMLDNYKKHKHPKGLVHHYGNATKAGVAEVFNQCKAYLMPSISEGLNLTPIESTLCGCPAVICDGAINEIFFDEVNCIVCNNGTFEMELALRDLVTNFDSYSKEFKEEMQFYTQKYTWSNVANKLKELL